MITRPLLVLAFLIACSSCGQDVSKTLDVPAARLAEIIVNPHTGGNGPGAFATN